MSVSDDHPPVSSPCHHGWRGAPAERITTPCPACGARTLFVGSGGHLTCGRLDCRLPGVEEAIEGLRLRARQAEAELRLHLAERELLQAQADAVAAGLKLAGSKP